MVFSSLIFLFLFLPIVILGNLIAPKSWRNFFLLLASILFYSWGEGIYALIMVASISFNWFMGKAIYSKNSTPTGKKLLTAGVIVNLLPLLFFKYIDFITTNLNQFFAALTIPIAFEPVAPHLPIGISFFTFQALSYLIDVYRNTCRPQKNLINIGLYISFFPQLIAGPIIRYHDIARQLVSRRVNSETFTEGVSRFVFGLAKKVLLANPLGLMADTVFSLPASELSTPIAWLGAVCYTLQIYFDFSGYSDMAIGLGRMFGFRFLENFNYPYIARSVREFWKRWHISLSNWLRDYLYIPLGGNQRGQSRTFFNLMTVFLLCGLWHGASWNFLLWGLVHGLFLLLERGPLAKIIQILPKTCRHIYLLFFIVNSWVLFRLDSLEEIKNFYVAMYGLSQADTFLFPVVHLLDASFFLTFGLAILLITPLFKSILNLPISERISPNGLSKGSVIWSLCYSSLLGMLMLGSIMSLATGAYNPFIYFRF